ncbi:hypothetical protein NPIL_358661 [Nephila pilipes]|uniref:Uncharacterized protein n=1 Tax=Nephila pilipes TaxID=299642 RepID=A0A8X6PFA4_NEPPI|nr:hypothetical protein NPIL_358661 [Nephila pilipes]
MFFEILAKTILLVWIRCMIGLVFLNSYEIVFMLPFIIILDRIARPSSERTPTEDAGSSITSLAAQEDREDKKTKKTAIKGKEEAALNEMILKLMYIEKKKFYIIFFSFFV